MPSYFIFRVLTAFQGTSFLVVGSSAVGDIYEPRTRATALVWVLSGSMVGPALGPFLGVCYPKLLGTIPVANWKIGCCCYIRAMESHLLAIERYERIRLPVDFRVLP